MEPTTGRAHLALLSTNISFPEHTATARQVRIYFHSPHTTQFQNKYGIPTGSIKVWAKPHVFLHLSKI